MKTVSRLSIAPVKGLAQLIYAGASSVYLAILRPGTGAVMLSVTFVGGKIVQASLAPIRLPGQIIRSLWSRVIPHRHQVQRWHRPNHQSGDQSKYESARRRGSALIY